MKPITITPNWLWDDRKETLTVLDIMDSLGVSRKTVVQELIKTMPHHRMRDCSTSRYIIHRADFALWLTQNAKWKERFARRMMDNEEREGNLP